MNRAFSVFALLFAVACSGTTSKSDTADSGTTSDTDTSDTNTSAPHVDSCNFDLGFCAEFTDFASTEAVCNGFDSGTESTTLPSTYTDAACPSGAAFVCDLPGIGAGDAANEPLVVYYYDDFPSDPAQACTDAGGTAH